MWFFWRRKKKEIKPVKEEVHSTYPNFPYHAGEVKYFLPSREFFTIMLKDQEIIHHEPEDMQAFHNWLLSNKIPVIYPDKIIDRP